MANKVYKSPLEQITSDNYRNDLLTLANSVWSGISHKPTTYKNGKYYTSDEYGDYEFDEDELIYNLNEALADNPYEVDADLERSYGPVDSVEKYLAYLDYLDKTNYWDKP